MSDPHVSLSWRPLRQSDLAALTGLAHDCLAADGGQPFATLRASCAAATFARTRGRTPGSWCGSHRRVVAATAMPAGTGDAAVTTGLVHPAWRRRGIGRHAFDWAADAAAGAVLRAETEALGAGAHALYLSKGLAPVFAEDVMRLPPGPEPPPVPTPGGLILSQWGHADPARFHAVYEAAFRERPGFPGWSQAHWIERTSGDEDFRAPWSVLATLGGADVGFVTAAAGGWIAQVGVVPAARGAAWARCLSPRRCAACAAPARR